MLLQGRQAIAPSPRRLAKRRATCLRKRRYPDWDAARQAGIETWHNAPWIGDANMPLPYPCDEGGERHYHIGHLRFGGGVA